MIRIVKTTRSRRPRDDGGIIIAKDKPANGDYQLSQRIPKHLPTDVIKNQFRNVLRTLPVLSVK